MSFDLTPANDNTPPDLTDSDDLFGRLEQAEAHWFSLPAYIRQLQQITDGPLNDNSHKEAGRITEIIYDLICECNVPLSER